MFGISISRESLSRALVNGLLPFAVAALAIAILGLTTELRMPLSVLLLAVCYSAMTQVPGAALVSILAMSVASLWALLLPETLPFITRESALTYYLQIGAGAVFLVAGAYFGLRRHAEVQDEIKRERAQALEHTAERWRERNQTLLLLNEATNLLSSSRSPEEVAEIVSRYLPRVFPHTAGAVYFGGRVNNDNMHWTSQWGTFEKAPPATFDFNSCWSLRRGQPHSYFPGEATAPPCPHTGRPEQTNHCLPIIVNGRTMGLLTLRQSADSAEDEDAALDMTLLKALNEQMGLALANLRLTEDLREQAVRDPLTMLFNRRWFEEEVERLLVNAERHNKPIALIMLDIDNFKLVNDNYGHAVGDELLCHIANLMQIELRAGDIGARYGGEEFVIALPGHDSIAAIRLAERLRNVINQEKRGKDKLPSITVSMGIASYPSDGLSLKSILKLADDALYEAKRRGRNRVHVHGMTVAQISPPKAVAGGEQQPG